MSMLLIWTFSLWNIFQWILLIMNIVKEIKFIILQRQVVCILQEGRVLQGHPGASISTKVRFYPSASSEEIVVPLAE